MFANEITTGLLIAVGGSLINFTATKIYNSLTGRSKNFIWKDKKDKLTTMRTHFNFDELKKRVRIVVIDDEESFPIKLFQSEGYAIDKWDKVTNYSYGKLESGFYDIIVLDIKGVAEDISAEDGLGVLESLKEKNPAQIIIAYSQHSYDLSKVKFWELADEKIAKPSDFLKMKSIIDNLITTKFKPDRYIESLHLLLEKNNFSKHDIRKLDSTLENMIKEKQQPNWKQVFSSIGGKTQLIEQLISISNTILKFFQ